jgi:hypothetical protein
MPPPLPYFKVNICPFPLPHFASISKEEEGAYFFFNETSACAPIALIIYQIYEEII